MNDNDGATRRENLNLLLGMVGGTLGVAAASGCAAASGDTSRQARATAALSGMNIQWVDTAESLRGLSGGANFVALLEGYHAPNDGGGGIFVWSDTAATDDAGTFLNAGGLGWSAAGWRRLYSGPLDIRWFGAHPDNTDVDNFTAIERALLAASNAGGGTVYVPAGHYKFGNDQTPLILNEHISLVGDGLASILDFTGRGVALRWQPSTGTGVEMLSEIANLQITATGSASTVAVYMSDTYRAVMRNVSIFGSGAGQFSQAGIVMEGEVQINCKSDNVAFSHIEECSIILCGGDGIQLLGNIFSCTALRSQFSNNGVWGVHSPAGVAVINGFSVIDCDLEGNGSGGISGTFHHARFVGNYFEHNPASSSCPFLSVQIIPTHPAGDPAQYGWALEVAGNRVSSWVGPYAIDVFCSGLIGMSVCNNYFAASVGARGNVAAGRIQGALGLLLRGNSFATLPGFEVVGNAHSNDLGLDVRVYRFALGALPDNQTTALPLDSPRAAFAAFPLPHGGYVLGATVGLSRAPTAGTVAVQVQRNQSLVGRLDTGPFATTTADTFSATVGGSMSIADRLATGDLLGVVATTSGSVGAPDIVVDVVVGFGDIGAAAY